MVDYISGEAGHYPLKPYVLSESTLIKLGRLLRRFHDATVSFSPPKVSFGITSSTGHARLFVTAMPVPTISSFATVTQLH